MIKTIQGTFATSQGVHQLRVSFDQDLEIITEIIQGHIDPKNVDYHFIKIV